VQPAATEVSQSKVGVQSKQPLFINKSVENTVREKNLLGSEFTIQENEIVGDNLSALQSMP